MTYLFVENYANVGDRGALKDQILTKSNGYWRYALTVLMGANGEFVLSVLTFKP